MPNNQEITGTFIEETHIFLNDGGLTRVTIGIMECGDAEVVIKGQAEEGELVPGLEYRIYGRWVVHPQHGRQFAFQTFVKLEPATERAVVTYLRQYKGIGFVVAKRLWERYGKEAVAVLRETPDRVVKEIKGLTTEKATAAAALMQENVKSERAKMDVLELLAGRGFRKKTIEKITRDYGCGAAKEIRREPYILMRYPGVGFSLSDRLYLEIGKDPAKLKRQALCAWNAIAEQGTGDTWFAQTIARNAIHEKISGAAVNVEGAMRLGTGRLFEIHRDAGTTWVAEKINADREKDIAEWVVEAQLGAEKDGILWPSAESITAYPHQQEQVGLAMGGLLGILAGSPGTGKTHTTAEIIRSVIEAGWSLENIAVAAPTGKAAVRMSAALVRANIPLTATTIHSLLEVQTSEGGGWHFRYGGHGGEFLPHKFIFIDEVSMLDLSLMWHVLSARHPSTHILFVGDINQLPPVGAGAPIRDMIAAGVPTGTLTEIQRNSGRIVKACAEIRDRKRFLPSTSLDLENGENLFHIEKNNPDDQIDTLEKIIGRIADEGELDPVWDVQVIVAVNDKSPLGRKPLNRRLQRLLNPNRPRDGSKFAVKDKVINLRNGWFTSARPESDQVNAEGKVYVANGEQGEVVEVIGAKTIVRLTDPDRTVMLFRSPQEESQDGEEASKDDDKEAAGGSSWDLAYAVSCHKSQGSEWPVVLILADDHNSAKRVCTRNWIFTAISRARKYCLTIGKIRTVQEMMPRDGMKRKTFLREFIGLERQRVIVRSWGETEFAELLEGVC